MIKGLRIAEFLKRYDFSFYFTSFAIFCIGILNLYSATHATHDVSDLYQTQILNYLFSLFVAIMVSFIPPKYLLKLSYPAYFFILLLLLLVFTVGDIGMGAQRWLVLGPIRVQPSEFMKVGVVLALARWFSKSHNFQELGFKDLIVPSIIAGVPAVLVIVQPDLGTGLLILLIFSVITFYMRLRWKTITIIAILCSIGGGFMYKYGLKEYQRKRILTFINPDEDVKGSGYNAIQSKIAIGSGRFWGKGFKKSTQASLSYLPENHTDFIFSIYNEEHGFFFAVILIALYISLLLRFINLSMNVMSFYDSVVCIGLMSIFFFHTFVNMGMVMGLLPVVGLPLPYMSYGGSSLLTFGICVGIATSISNAKNMF